MLESFGNAHEHCKHFIFIECTPINSTNCMLASYFLLTCTDFIASQFKQF